jgi:serine/threonine-protein kinase
VAIFRPGARDQFWTLMAQIPDAGWWPRLDATFQGALELPTEDRAAYLDRVCGQDADLRAEVEAMLAADAPQCALDIERLVHDEDARSSEADPFIGIQLGPWRVIDTIGHGGMGTVYLAERDDGQYEQRVALKLVRGRPHPRGSRRFTDESRILARLSHANVARLIDAGQTPEGSTYLVMEYVDGQPVTAYADAHRLTVDDRLRLFRIVCEATEHAHHALVVHRDLKPSNILVSRAGEVKLLDFGIARLLEPDQPLADPTTPELRALTPAYAAPEQLLGQPVGTPADVYVLGAVLYELLAGQRPGNLDAAGVSRDVAAAPPPSAALRRLIASGPAGARTAAATAAARQATPARLIRRLSGDVDGVILKALQLQPERRYGSAGQLADDLQRLVDGRPVMAQPDTRGYRLRRFAGRHRVGVAMAAVVAALVVAFAIVAALQARAVGIERDRARVEATRAARVARLVTDLFRLAEPGAGRGSTISARELLDRGSHRIALELGDDPATQAALSNAISRVYANLGLHDAAIEVLERALAGERTAGGDAALAHAETLHLLAERHASKNDFATAERLFRDALARRRRLGAPAVDVAATLEGLGRTLNGAGRYADAQAMLEEALAIRRRAPGATPAEVASGLHELGLLVHFAGDTARAERLFREAVAVGRDIAGPSPAKVTSLLRHAELVSGFDRKPADAEPLLREALAMARTIYPDDHQDTANCLNALSLNLLRLRKLTEAAGQARESLAMNVRLNGDRHEETLRARLDLARVLNASEDFPSAERVLRESLPHARAMLGDGHPTTIVTARGLATVIEQQRRFAEALALRREELARTAKARGDTDVFVATGLAELGQHGLTSGRLALAEEYFDKALELRRKIHPAGHWRIDEARGLVGLARLRAGRYTAAEADLLAAYDGLVAHRGGDTAETKAVRARLVDLYERWNRPERARQYRAPRG